MVARRWLVVLITAASLTGCGSKETTDLQTLLQDARAEIPSIITDPNRAAQVEIALDSLGSAFRASAAERRDLAVEWRHQYRSYDAARPALEELLRRHHEGAEALRGRALQAREQVRTVTTEAEWKQLAKNRKKIADELAKAAR